MSGNGLVYAIIVGIWVAVVLPLLLRRHDPAVDPHEAARGRAGTPVRLLARGDATRPDRRARPTGGAGTAQGRPADGEHPTRDGWSTGRSATGSLDPADGADRADRADPAGRAGRAALLARRRRTLVALVATAGVLAIAFLAGQLPAAPALIGAVAVALFLVHCRRQRHAAPAPAPALRGPAGGRRVDGDSADGPIDATGVPVPDAADGPGAVSPGTSGAAARRYVDDRFLYADDPFAPDPLVRVDPAGQAGASVGGWVPVPVPLPTYVTAPKAVRSARTRTIDLSTDAWASGPFTTRVEESVPVVWDGDPYAGTHRDPYAAAAPASAEYEEYELEHRRAVGD